MLEKPPAQRDAIATTQRGVPRRGTFERKKSHLRNTTLNDNQNDEIQKFQTAEPPQLEDVTDSLDEDRGVEG